MVPNKTDKTDNPTPFTANSSLVLLMAVCFCALCWTGCSSTGKPAGGPSVVIDGNTPGQIHDVAVEVFKKNGYQVTSKDLEAMVFEKEATKWSNFAYGNWEEDTPVWVRVKASIVAVSEARFRLKCKAYVVRDRGGVMEEEIACLRSAPYQKLMDEVAARLHGEMPPATKP